MSKTQGPERGRTAEAARLDEESVDVNCSKWETYVFVIINHITQLAYKLKCIFVADYDLITSVSEPIPPQTAVSIDFEICLGIPRGPVCRMDGPAICSPTPSRSF